MLKISLNNVLKNYDLASIFVVRSMFFTPKITLQITTKTVHKKTLQEKTVQSMKIHH